MSWKQLELFDPPNKLESICTATYRGVVYHLVESGNEEDPSACDDCRGYGNGDFCIETEYACINNHGYIWKEIK